jgi:hypothetical protein
MKQRLYNQKFAMRERQRIALDCEMAEAEEAKVQVCFLPPILKATGLNLCAETTK